MIDQDNESKQMLIEAKIRNKLNELYPLIQAWDGAGNFEMAEEMSGYVAEWKAKLEGDEASVDGGE